MANPLQPHHLGRWMILQGVAGINHQLGALEDRGVVEIRVIGYDHHAIGFRGHRDWILRRQLMTV